jgi:hypothetical protein
MRHDGSETRPAGWHGTLEAVQGAAEASRGALTDALSGATDHRTASEIEALVAELGGSVASTEQAMADFVGALALDEIAKGPVAGSVFTNADEAVVAAERHRAAIGELAASTEGALAYHGERYREEIAALTAVRHEKPDAETPLGEVTAGTARLLVSGEQLFRTLNRHVGSCDIVLARLRGELERLVLLHAAVATGVPAAPESFSGTLFALQADGLLDHADTRRRLDAAREAFAARFAGGGARADSGSPAARSA